jgi:hypothetical protein
MLRCTLMILYLAEVGSEIRVCRNEIVGKGGRRLWNARIALGLVTIHQPETNHVRELKTPVNIVYLSYIENRC